MGTLGLEFIRLSELTGNGSYAWHAESIIQQVSKRYTQALLPIYISAVDGHFTSQTVGMGAMADSTYEYYLKVWHLKGRTEGQDFYRDMWVKAMEEVRATLLQRANGTTYVTDTQGGVAQGRMEHLTCFLPGNLALGVLTGAVEGPQATDYLLLAKALTETCYRMYNSTLSGLAGEAAHISPDGALHAQPAYNILRPETVESFYMLYQATGERKYQDWGWEVFSAIEKWCKVPTGGYAGVVDVNSNTPQIDDKMQSFWLAETLKYLYLLFSSDKSLLDLGKYVLNTEAHPLRVLKPLTMQQIVNASRR